VIGRAASLACAALLLAGCAATRAPFESHLASEAPPVRACAEWFQALDAEIDAAGVRDAQDARVRGFPYLRVNRLLAALAPRAAADWNTLHALADRMTGLDLAARRAEIANLPEERLRALPGLVLDARRGEAATRTRECARLLREIDFAKPVASALALERARVPDDYSGLQRVLGLYALSRIPFAAGVRRWEAETLAAFERRVRGVTAPGRVRVRFAPTPAARLGYSGVAGILAGAANNPLGIPEPAAQDLELLLAAHAPSFEIEVAGDADRFGRLHWVEGAPSPEVDAALPTVYARAAHTVYRDRVLLQLVYTIWFPERPPQAPGDILSGRLDGVVWRVTLAEDGEPVLFDSIHPCGCYHLFFPTPRARPIPPPGGLREWAFAPAALPRLQPGERALLHVAAGTHYLEGVELVSGLDSLARYRLASEEDLRSLPHPGGGRRSAFGPDGLVPGTEREERRLFWPMGIASAGAMRQWGRHATAFVGRRHFDDADLLERRFVLEPP
jgi:hypothetical protein